jgi:hypothetical protein
MCHNHYPRTYTHAGTAASKMATINQGSTMGFQTINNGSHVINSACRVSVQCCYGGTVVNDARTHIKTRYVPPGSTCVIKDDPGTKIDQVVHDFK